jgi:hypothetical protein
LLPFPNLVNELSVSAARPRKGGGGPAGTAAANRKNAPVGRARANRGG